MTKKEQSELSKLNSKFDILISLLTQQLKPQMVVESPKVIVEEEDVIAKDKPKFSSPTVSKLKNLVPQKVSLYVDPKYCAQINGRSYEGHITVPADVAVELRRLMHESNKVSERANVSITHTTRNHIVPGGI